MRMYFFYFFLSVNFLAQKRKTGSHFSSFSVTSFVYKHNEKWGAYMELQMRSLEKFGLPDYYEIKGGPNYNFNKNNQVLIGMGRYGTYNTQSLYLRETRFWLQYVLSHKVARLKIDHRLRTEQRYFYFVHSKNHAQDIRFRYRLSLILPVNKSKVEKGTVFVGAHEEFFFGKQNPDIFKRNRLYGGLGYQVSSLLITQLGYLWQKEYSSLADERNYHFVYIALNFTLDRQKLFLSSKDPPFFSKGYN
ncbi:MAG: DUF2490 domain-containing protein [Bergeyella sp.]|nr:DUF2490 domain-containing protein [Bergeyella sp.]